MRFPSDCLDFRGKTAIVTGGSRGIGRAAVLALAQAGATVAACHRRSTEETDRLAAELKELDNRNLLVQADVADEDDVARFVDEAVQQLGKIDILVNNAGVVSHASLGDLTLAEWRRTIDTNLTGAFLVTRALLPSLRAGGSVVNISSAVATVGMVGRTHYTSSKAGLVGFNRSLCKELGSRGIRANVIAPGIIETDQVSGLTPEVRSRYEQLAALGRLGRPEDIADAVLYLASDLSQFVSGITLVVDGGI